MSAVIDIAKDIAESVRKHDWTCIQCGKTVSVLTSSESEPCALLICSTEELAAHVVALARGEK